MDIVQKLCAPFEPSKVSWRVGSTNADKTQAMALAYIDARDVMERLDEVVGPFNWQCHYSHADKKTICELSIRVWQEGYPVMGEWVTKSNGAGDSDIEAEKGAISDAFKRAAVNWGIGRYLYDVKSPWVNIVKRGNTYFIDPNELPKLQRVLPAVPRETKKVEFTPEQLEKAAVKHAEALVSLMPDDTNFKSTYLKENADTIARCEKYPKAHAVLAEAGLV